MRTACAGISVLTAMFALAAGAAYSGEENIDMYNLKYGMRYCPAPWCDNKEFLDTHFGIDAKTGKLTKYVGNVHPDEVGDTSGGEQLLYVAPPISVENRYVPPAGVSAPRVAAAPAAQSYSYYPQSAPPQRSQAYAQPASRPQQPVPQSMAARKPAAPPPAKRAATNGRQESARLPWWKAMWK